MSNDGRSTGQTCVTCVDQTVPVRVLRLLADGLALVDTGVGVEEVSVALVPVQVGDRLLMHAKEAIAVLGQLPGGGPAVVEVTTGGTP